ncbi:glycine betaine/proline transport system substrate-binding protein [Sphaerotilus hippei]|uniref:Glycine betaine/proline transport system substrate-binding protein n=1 Tax=Sphaerotilus hippei TaxID=744406 RepID=A0A318H5W3_9BURK|nr:choline ABC transporter substrate-binding protein [Sphaerotilus hippei]PXW99330.1 glycine betaine/proline transport system substrate-binding protein [Sphaerotilus hippei]
MKRISLTLVALAGMLGLTTAPAQAQEAAACQKVRFADVGWSDIAATTGLASVVLEAMGYQPTVTVASVPITFAGMKSKQLDAFLGYWNPSMTPMIEPFVKAGQIQVFETPNLVGAKYTLAVPEALHDAGLKDFKDLPKFAKALEGKIYGIEPGNDGNALIADMIKKNQYGLKDFKLVESSEAGMLAQVQRAARGKKPIVFLGWEPHPMNVQVKMKYLTGGDDVFGPNFGEARVFTAVPSGYEAKCPNVVTFLKNLQFTTTIENEVMQGILNKGKPNQVARDWLVKHPQAIEPWLKGVKTFKGEDALPVVRKALQG